MSMKIMPGTHEFSCQKHKKLTNELKYTYSMCALQVKQFSA